MRIIFDSFDAFCQDIAEQAKAVKYQTVRALTLRQPEQAENVTFQVGFMGTAVVVDEGEPCLLEVAIQCGQDEAPPRSRGVAVGPGKVAGSDGAVKLFAKLKSVCEEHGLKLRTGKIELY